MLTFRIEFSPLDIRLHAPGEMSNNALGLITKQLTQLKDLVMATSAELTAKLETIATQQQKTIGEIQALQGTVTELRQSVAELQAVIAAGGGDPPAELQAAVDKVATLAQQVDDAIPDVAPAP